jgi:hypothetical protein
LDAQQINAGWTQWTPRAATYGFVLALVRSPLNSMAATFVPMATFVSRSIQSQPNIKPISVVIPTLESSSP